MNTYYKTAHKDLTNFKLNLQKCIDGDTQKYQMDFNLARGNLIFFPAWLRYGVHPYNGNRERISIAPNIHCQSKN